MKLGNQIHDINCPHCGATTRVAFDTSGGEESFIDDCVVCCNAINLRVDIDEQHQQMRLFVDAGDEQYY
ncbi:CPXCG motif-containing cysteine-rich protein [Ferrimonas lipolytica]|uniref:CPXCG motif-containing cysteine-rich protein n=1 Tax=Ferrimonas lipolytica TaxID=2724191 RepID=A0A6H1UBS9_9GAMM|nr:CPXCG motif-containing cysteine-rich protein [Ferrimonas lipolytica]QIZ76515.1 CPXCG motif-containing cysteine-rich protein [Ferrimonas lipolytica]